VARESGSFYRMDVEFMLFELSAAEFLALYSGARVAFAQLAARRS
jgi:hypothetical protein